MVTRLRRDRSFIGRGGLVSLFMLGLGAVLIAPAGGLARMTEQQLAEQREPWRPEKYREPFTDAERRQPHVQARSHDVRDYPFLDGQWLGIATDEAGDIWFSFSSHDRRHHAQLFRYRPSTDRVRHVADLGQALGAKLTDDAPHDKIHTRLIPDGDVLYAGTCNGYFYDDHPSPGGHYLRIDRKTGKVTDLGRSKTGDGLLAMNYDASRGLLYGWTNRHGKLTQFDVNTGEERVLGYPYGEAKPAWPRGLDLMIAKDGKVYGARPPRSEIWVYDPETDRIEGLGVHPPTPPSVEAGDAKATEAWEQRATLHMTTWSEQDQCFYVIRSVDATLMRFFPPRGDKPARFEVVQRMGVAPHHHPACTLELHDRTIWFTPGTGWGGAAHLQSYHLDTGEFVDYGPIVVEGGRRVTEAHAMTVGDDGKLYLAAFVFSKEGVDPVRPTARRGRDWPFHSRLVIIDPAELRKPE